MINTPIDNYDKSGGSYPANFGCRIPIFFSKIAYPFTHSRNTDANPLTLMDKVIGFAPLFTCY